MGSKSGSSGGGGGNNNKPNKPRKQLTDKPIYADAIVRGNQGALSYIRTENKISEITQKQTSNPNRMKGSEDSSAIWSTVSSKPGNFVKDSKGNPIRTSSGKVVMTSKGRKEYNQAMRRIPLSKAQIDSQKKISNILSLPLMLVPGGGIVRAGIKNNYENASVAGGRNVMTYGGKNLLTSNEANIIARQQSEAINNRPMPAVDLSKRKRKSLLSTLFGNFGNLGSGGKF